MKANNDEFWNRVMFVYWVIILLAIMISTGLLINHFLYLEVDCSLPKYAQECSALYDVGLANTITGTAIETTLYQDENGTLREVTRDLGTVCPVECYT